jgi:CRP-like cAMP-binding protein
MPGLGYRALDKFNNVLFRQGDECDHCYVILGGVIGIFESTEEAEFDSPDVSTSVRTTVPPRQSSDSMSSPIAEDRILEQPNDEEDLAQHDTSFGRHVTTLEPGDLMGEYMDSNSVRTHTAVAMASDTTKCSTDTVLAELLVVDRRTYMEWLQSEEWVQKASDGKTTRLRNHTKELVRMEQCRRVFLRKPASTRTDTDYRMINDVLIRQPFISQLPASTVRVLGKAVTMLEIATDEVVCWQGNTGDCLYIVLRGSVNGYAMSSKEMAAKAPSHHLGNIAMSSSRVAKKARRNSSSNIGKFQRKLSGQNPAVASILAFKSINNQPGSDTSSNQNSTEQQANAQDADNNNAMRASFANFSRKNKKIGGDNKTPQPEFSLLGAQCAYGELVSVRKNGDAFGESSLQNSEPHPETIIAREPTELLVIHKRDYDNIVTLAGRVGRRLSYAPAELKTKLRMVEEIERQLSSKAKPTLEQENALVEATLMKKNILERLLRPLAVFHDLSPVEFDHMVGLMTPVNTNAGENVFKIGDKTSWLGILVVGSIDILDGHHHEVLHTVSIGEQFGHHALIWECEKRFLEVRPLRHNIFYSDSLLT